MKTRFGIGLGILVAGLTAGICFFGVACGGDDDDDTTGTGTGTGSGSGSGTGTGTGTGVNCTQVCSDVYTCGKSGTPQLCPGFIDQCISEAAWTNGAGGGGGGGGCLATCAGPTGAVLAGLVNPSDCSATVTALKGADADFQAACEGIVCGMGAGGGGGGTP